MKKETLIKKDIFILLKFINVYCMNNHSGEKKSVFHSQHINSKEDFSLCSECTSLARYSIEKRVKCPLEIKPSCKNCAIKCFSLEYNSRIKEVMKFSGMYFIKKGRIDYLLRYLF